MMVSNLFKYNAFSKYYVDHNVYKYSLADNARYPTARARPTGLFAGLSPLASEHRNAEAIPLIREIAK